MRVGFVCNLLDLISATLQHICSALEEVIAFDLYFEVLTARNEFVLEFGYFIHEVIQSGAY